MIIGFNPTSLDILRRLQLSRTKFYLTGSRFFGYPHPNSDWDFFTESSERTRDSIEALGFNRLSMNPDWFDNNCDMIFKHSAGVHITFTLNIELKKAAQVYIRDIEPRLMEALKLKENAQDIWNHVYLKCLRDNVYKTDSSDR